MTNRRNSANSNQHGSSSHPPEVVAGTRNLELLRLNPPLGYRERMAELHARYHSLSHEPDPESEPEFEEESEQQYEYEFDDREQHNADSASNHSAQSDEPSDSDASDERPDEIHNVLYDPVRDDLVYQDPSLSSSQPDMNDDIPYDHIIGERSNSLSQPDQPDSVGHPSADERTGHVLEHGEHTEINDSELVGSHAEETQPHQPPNDDYILINTQLSPPRNSGRSRGGRSRPIVIDTTQPEVESFQEPPILVEISPSPRRTRRGTTDNDARETQKTKSNKRRLSSLRSAAQREDQDIGDGSGSNGVAIDELDLMAEQSPSKKLKKTVGGGNDKPDPSVALRPRIMFKCAVCLDSPDPAVFVHPCGHVFCESCAQSASQSTGKCPVCRHSMRPKDIRILQFRVAAITR